MGKQVVSPKVAKDIDSLTIGNEIPSNADLDDYKTIGIYRITNASIAQSLSNCPIDQAGALHVEILNNADSSQRCLQRIIPLGFGVNEYRRTLKSDGWSNWDNLCKGMDITDNMTIATGITLKCGGIYRLGNLIIIQLRFYTTGGTFTDMISGLPVPLCTLRNTQLSSNIVMLSSNVDDQLMFVSSDGIIRHMSTSPDFDANKEFFITGCYICE